MTREVNVEITTESQTVPIEDGFVVMKKDGTAMFTDKTETTEFLSREGEVKTYMTITDQYSSMSVEQLRDELRRRDRLSVMPAEMAKYENFDFRDICVRVKAGAPVSKSDIIKTERALGLIKEYYFLITGEEI